MDDLWCKLSRIGPPHRKDIVGTVLCLDGNWILFLAVRTSCNSHQLHALFRQHCAILKFGLALGPQNQCRFLESQRRRFTQPITMTTTSFSFGYERKDVTTKQRVRFHFIKGTIVLGMDRQISRLMMPAVWSCFKIFAHH